MRWLPTAVLWLATRAWVLFLLLGPHSWVGGDVSYFAQSLQALGRQGLSQTLVEYPVPGVALLALPWLAVEAVGRPQWYAGLVVVLALATDAGFLVLLRGLPGGRRPAPVLCWLLAVPLLGATTYARFDLLPGVLVGVALLLLRSRPGLAGAAAALATGTKLWPALVLPALGAPRVRRSRFVTVLAGVGAVLAVGSLLAAGWSRLVSPLGFQAGRGLQIEAVLATPAMLAWAREPGRYAVGYSQHNAFEVSGPGVGLLLAGTDLLSVLLVLALLLLWWRAWASGGALRPETVGWLVLAAVTGFVVTSKVLSPQYLLWLLPAAAALLATAGPKRRTLSVWVGVLLVATGLTQLVFPVFYGQLVRPGQWSGPVVLLLAARNLLLVWLALSAWTAAWRRVGAQDQRGRALERHAPGPGR
jgi:hypothetical protein